MNIIGSLSATALSDDCLCSISMHARVYILVYLNGGKGKRSWKCLLGYVTCLSWQVMGVPRGLICAAVREIRYGDQSRRGWCIHTIHHRDLACLRRRQHHGRRDNISQGNNTTILIGSYRNHNSSNRLQVVALWSRWVVYIMVVSLAWIVDNRQGDGVGWCGVDGIDLNCLVMGLLQTLDLNSWLRQNLPSMENITIWFKLWWEKGVIENEKGCKNRWQQLRPLCKNDNCREQVLTSWHTEIPDTHHVSWKSYQRQNNFSPHR